MNPLMQTWMQTIGWTLLHFVWQGALLAIVTAACLRLSRHRSAEARYAIGCVGLAAMLAAPAVTAAVSWQPLAVAMPGRSPAAVAVGSDGSLAEPAATDARSSRERSAPAWRTSIDDWLPLVVWTWLAGVTLLLARLAAGCWGVHRLRVASHAAPASSWQPIVERLAARLHVHVAVRVVETALVDAPSVIGALRPIVLLPIAVLTTLSPVQIEALLAHELAHVRRRDYAVNLLQTVAEMLLFFHPAVWWISSRIRQEREHCCDDVAVSVSAAPVEYAAALAELASWRTREVALSVGAADGQLLARVRRLLGTPADDSPRAAGGLAVLALGMTLVAGVGVRSMTQSPSPAAERATAAAAPAVSTSQSAGTWLTRATDHFEINYTPGLDLHAERVARDGERAYERISADLRHNLAFRVPVFLFRDANEFERNAQARPLAPGHAASSAEPLRDRIVLATDRPADQWYGLLTHELAHIFGFDILPGASTPTWISEGLAEYERGEWEPSDLAVLRDAVRSSATPALSRLNGGASGNDARLVYGLGHAAFEFIESRWGKPGLRQFLFALRQAARSSSDPFESAFQMSAAAFDQEFARYLRERFTVAAAASPLPERFNLDATVRIEGDITAISAPVAAGRACIELWVPGVGTLSQRWGIECGSAPATDVVRALRPGDRVIVTGAPARAPAVQRMVVRSLERRSDGFIWRADAQ